MPMLLLEKVKSNGSETSNVSNIHVYDIGVAGCKVYVYPNIIPHNIIYMIESVRACVRACMRASERASRI